MSSVSSTVPAADRGERALLTASSISYLGDGVSAAAMTWLLATVGASPFFLGILGTCMVLPTLLLSSRVGHAADRHNRRTLVLLTLGLRAGVTLLIALLAAHDRDAWAWPWLVALLACALAFGLLEMLGSIALAAAVPSIVPAARLPQVLGRMSAARSGAKQVLGLPLGGELIAVAGTAAAFVFDAMSFIGCGLLLLLVTGWTRQERARPRSGPAAELPGVVRFVHEAPAVRAVLYPWAVTNVLTGAAYVEIALFVRDSAGSHSLLFSLLVGASGAGVVAGGFIIGRGASRREPSKPDSYIATAKYHLVLLVKGGALVMVALMQAYPVVVAGLLFITGITMTMNNAWSRAELQRSCDDHQQGILSAAILWYTFGLVPVVALPASLVLTMLGLQVRWLFLLAGLGTIAVAVRLRAHQATFAGLREDQVPLG